MNIIEIVELHKSGLTKQNIADLYGVSRKTVEKYIKDSGIVLTRCNTGPVNPLFFMVFSRLTVTDTFKRRIKNGKKQILYKCVCECGNITWVPRGDLIKGRTKSCGCFTVDRITKAQGESAKNSVLRQYKMDANKRGYSWELTDEEALEIMSRNCYYCGQEPYIVMLKKRMNGEFTYNGIDRVDNTKGYTLDNCVPCCNKCNKAKHAMTEEEWYDWIDHLARHQGYNK